MMKLTDRDFLKDSDYTGRFIVISKTGKKYYIEPIGSPHTGFGDVNPATKKVEGSYGDKYPGSIQEHESLLTIENGFDPVLLPPGVSPLSFIQGLGNNTTLCHEYFHRNSI